MTGPALTVPPFTDRYDGSAAVTTPTLMEITPTLRKLVMDTLYGITGKARGYL